MTKTAVISVVMLFASFSVFAQSSLPKLEVASIKELSSNDALKSFECGSRSFTISGNRVVMSKVTACGLIRTAYFLMDYEVVGAPNWTKDGWPLTYEIQAIAEGSETLTRERALELLQVILAERFQLKFHKEMREMAVYALIVGKDGPKFTATLSSDCAKALANNAAISMTFRISLGANGIRDDRPGMVSMCKPTTIDRLARTLTLQLDRPVVDRTGLTEEYVYELSWEDRASLFSALQEQLGLQLVARKEQVQVMVIDGIERPTAN